MTLWSGVIAGITSLGAGTSRSEIKSWEESGKHPVDEMIVVPVLSLSVPDIVRAERPEHI